MFFKKLAGLRALKGRAESSEPLGEKEGAENYRP